MNLRNVVRDYAEAFLGLNLWRLFKERATHRTRLNSAESFTEGIVDRTSSSVEIQNTRCVTTLKDTLRGEIIASTLDARNVTPDMGPCGGV